MKKEILVALFWGGGIILLALAASFARSEGYVSHDTVLRVVIGMNGLMIAYFGNRMPKAIAPGACARQVTRVAGWSMVVSGLLYALLWAFAPIPVAIAIGCSAVAAGVAVTVVYCLRLRGKARAHREGGSA